MTKKITEADADRINEAIMEHGFFFMPLDEKMFLLSPPERNAAARWVTYEISVPVTLLPNGQAKSNEFVPPDGRYYLVTICSAVNTFTREREYTLQVDDYKVDVPDSVDPVLYALNCIVPNKHSVLEIRRDTPKTTILVDQGPTPPPVADQYPIVETP